MQLRVLLYTNGVPYGVRFAQRVSLVLHCYRCSFLGLQIKLTLEDKETGSNSVLEIPMETF